MNTTRIAKAAAVTAFTAFVVALGTPALAATATADARGSAAVTVQAAAHDKGLDGPVVAKPYDMSWQ
ncbi:hypothetical protein ABT354_11680 [Streptomyces sp. NPDC000594]|uniref:hypothetical protein n=1 Tax=Streptomyces sp. NPDC000594 TaxID=3154261 RepID=UPI00331E510D